MAGRRDEYGNPIPAEQQQGYGTVTGGQYRTGTGAGYGSGAGDYYGTNVPHETVVGAGGQPQQVRPEKQEGHGLSGMLHRSGSSSSSSSEDDGHGGRRKKKGMKEKIKEKLPGGHKQDEEHGHPTTGYGGTTTTTGHGTTTGGYGGATTGYSTHDQPEKKGIMDKIKEKLPGSHH